jgi:ABC-type glycerol-3-phosphate transport system substrate-binding protein
MMLIKVKKKIAVILMVAIFLTITLAGCRSKNAPDPTENFEGVELTYYKVFDKSSVIKPYIGEYLATHPGLNINYREFDDFEEYQDTILNEMAEGGGPDVFSMQNTWFAFNTKKLAPMPEELGTIDDFEKLFVDVAYKDLVRLDENGYEQIYGLPMTVDTLALYYNKDHFEDRLPTQGRPSATWEGIEDDVVKLNKDGRTFSDFAVSGIAMGRSDNISRAIDILYLLFLQYGADFYNDDYSKAVFAGRQGGADYPGLKALNYFVAFADGDQKHYAWDQYIADPLVSDPEIEAFARGDVSMIVGFAYTYDTILEKINEIDAEGESHIDDDAIRIAEIPQLEDPAESGGKRVTYAGYFAETVSKNAEHPALAWDFLIHMTQKEILEDYFEKTHKPTSRRDMIDDQKKDPNYGVFASQIGYAESFPIANYYIYKEIFENVIARANKEGAYKSGLLEAQNLVNDLLPENGLVVEKVEVEEVE